MEEKKPVAFDEEQALNYDKKNIQLAAINDSIHLLSRIILSELPANARILIVGAGTGVELLFLANAYPGWHFTAVDPSEPMLRACRRKAEEKGIADRCTFHQGYLDTLPETPPFDAATSFLVSHFILDRNERVAFFRQIANRLVPNGILINSDLTSDTSADHYQPLMDVWRRLLKYAGWPAENVDKLPEVYKQHVGVIAPKEVESIIEAAGFVQPVLFFQNFLIHAWFSKRA